MPMRSISSNGPIGNPPARTAASIASTGAAPVSSSRSASIVNGRLTRLTMNPGVSAQRTGVLPQAVISATARSATAAVRGWSDDDLDERA